MMWLIMAYLIAESVMSCLPVTGIPFPPVDVEMQTPVLSTTCSGAQGGGGRRAGKPHPLEIPMFSCHQFEMNLY